MIEYKNGVHYRECIDGSFIMNLFFKLWAFEKRLEKGKFPSMEEKKKETEEMLSMVKEVDSQWKQVEDVLIEMKELAEMAADQSITKKERLFYQKQMNQLKKKLEQAEKQMRFNPGNGNDAPEDAFKKKE